MIRPPEGGRAEGWPGPDQFGVITSPSSLYDGSQDPGMGVCAVSAAGDGMQEGRWWWWWWWESLRAPVGPAQPSVTSQQVQPGQSASTREQVRRDQAETSPAILTAASWPLLALCTSEDSGGRLYFTFSTIPSRLCVYSFCALYITSIV